ncbi:MAG: anti-sigma factor family protein [Leptospirillia bacterium]
MTSCQDASVMITALVDGELGLDDLDRVRAHVEMCSDCQARKQMEARLKGFLKERLASVDPPAGLREKIQRALASLDPDCPSSALMGQTRRVE